MSLWQLLIGLSFAVPIGFGLKAGQQGGLTGMVIGLLVGLSIGIGNAWGMWTIQAYGTKRITKESTIAFIYLAVFVWSYVSGWLALTITRWTIQHLA